MSLWLIYILVMIPTIKGMIGVGLTPVGVGLAIVALLLTVLTFIGTSVLGFFSKETEESKVEVAARTTKSWKYFRGAVYTYMFAGLLFVLLPSERQMYVMAGAYAVTNIEGIKDLPSNAVGAANAWLKRLGEAAAADGDTAAVEQLSSATKALTAAPVK